MMTIRHFPSNAGLLPFKDFDRFFKETFGAFERPANHSRKATPQPLAPRVDVWEGEEAFELLFEIPGVTREDVELGLKDGRLTMNAEVKTKNPKESQGERPVRRYSRAVQLPSNLELDRIAAKLTDGVLVVSLPKVAAARPRTIEIG